MAKPLSGGDKAVEGTQAGATKPPEETPWAWLNKSGANAIIKIMQSQTMCTKGAVPPALLLGWFLTAIGGLIFVVCSAVLVAPDASTEMTSPPEEPAEWQPWRLYRTLNLSHARQEWAESHGYLFDGVPLPIVRVHPPPVHVSMVCLLPKCGSSFLKAALAMAVRPTIGGACEHVHCARLPYAVPMGRRALFATAPLYIVVRHPVSRLLSAWLDARAGHAPVRSGIIAALSAAGRAPNASANASANALALATFGDLVAAVVAHASRPDALNPHLRLQTRQCGWQSLALRTRYRVLQLERQPEWLPMLLAEWGGIGSDWRTRAMAAHRARRADALVRKYYTRAALMAVHTWARDDLVAFQYDRWYAFWKQPMPPSTKHHMRRPLSRIARENVTAFLNMSLS